MLIFYDITSEIPGRAWSPNTWKTRFCLNYKGIPYRTEWVEYPDIEPLCIERGIPPTSYWADGKPHYTLPAIHDPSTGTYIADSLLIAEYLDKTYPDTPRIFPRGLEALQLGFVKSFMTQLDSIWTSIIPQIANHLSPRSLEYFRRTREKSFHKQLEDIAPVGQAQSEAWDLFKRGLDVVNGWLEKNSASGPFVMADTVSWADFAVGGYLIWMKIVWGEDSQQWKDISSWGEGRWGALIEGLEKYSEIK
ncbi:uncharacterized protein LACBIDRAFT_295178 [Laccaria bicolor S238N-H82]|uniref:Predicted protein n=1 Tax=Laccaria bicolor (strain S238N-H82 / ATCC MYA-4686) TaxID=486041 RepID=B0DP16_LACBS|nr:uncharacterized protein LACBIDRAFT_295178 [Laccaria bicolor S238N-H82]EDR03530.1 predicted protein [Laccaria bicolor S238N-H82]|eukprot:XP_001885678.1 predicted protein [Laccaria bicolor S238N-H82]